MTKNLTSALTTGLIVFTLALASSLAHADAEIMNVQAPHLRGTVLFNIFEGHETSPTAKLSRLNLDLSHKTIELDYQANRHCPPNARCMQTFMMLPMNITVSTKIESIKTDGCGVVTYVGRQELATEGKIENEITVRDYSQSRCDVALSSSLTEVEYKQTTGAQVEINEHMSGLKLIEGGVQSYNMLSELSCNRYPQIMDASINTAVSTLIATTMTNKKVDLGRLGSLSLGSFGGQAAFRYFDVTREVSPNVGGGMNYTSMNAEYSLALPMVAPLPEGGNLGVLNVKVDSFSIDNQQMSCQRTR